MKCNSAVDFAVVLVVFVGVVAAGMAAVIGEYWFGVLLFVVVAIV